ncbi:hypothetical protein BDZ89DRAFT_1242391 [Hymenopellis radicata]|nr:hypothetical protein BDZ89DRAFT_1242391 [Hymenopellis radicata]
MSAKSQNIGDNLDSDVNHAWSYRTMDDDYEDAVNPYGGETMSTAAHHASGLTMNAGLHGRGGQRRDASLSGTEFDPDRPLRDLVGGVDSKLSAFDADPSRSRYPPPGNLTFDLVVDDTAELDRILESGYVPPPSLNSRSVRVQSHHSTSSSSSDSEGPSSRPKISDALRVRNSTLPIDEDNIPTPKPRNAKRTNIFASYTPPQQPEVRLHPPTPSSSSSRFSKMARGLTKELDEEVERARRHRKSDQSMDQTREHSRIVQPTPRRSSMRQPAPVGHVSKSKLYLPDVTGLTSAVESPMKGGLQHYPFNVSKEARESDARLLSAISAVQSKLRQLEAENGISRRRVRELEHELELCKIEVARERSILVQREEFLAQQQRETELEEARRRKGKGKAKARDASLYQEEVSRYQEIVEEKKALEALVTSLRSHLSRLTQELSSHQALLTELRTLRENDHQTLKDKSAEIDRLRAEVERLAGEVEVLRGVVEEGLKERRTARENSQAARSRMDEPNPVPVHEEESHQSQPPPEESSSEDEEEEVDDGDFDPISIPGSSRANIGNVDKTMRTDHATLGSSHMGISVNPSRFINDEELEQISADIEERRSGRSSIASRSLDEEDHTSRSPADNMTELERTAQLEEVEVVEEERAPSPGPSRRRRQDLSTTQPPPRPAAPTPGHATRHNRRRRQALDDDEEAFPQIRGAHLERLFFSAPPHNAKTCTVCFRRRRNCDDRRPTSPSWLPNGFERSHHDEEGDSVHAAEDEQEEDEGFAEGSEEMDQDVVRPRSGSGAGTQMPSSRAAFAGHGTKNGVPPQTVLMRVIRELEDDFTHYKSVYVELADQYKVMDAVSDVPKRNLVARHLREVVDILEQKGDQIANLTDLLTFKDKSYHEARPQRQASKRNPTA